MRIYDPAERIVYVHLTSSARQQSAPQLPHDAALDRLPVGYANQSPRTRVRRDPKRRSANQLISAEGVKFEPTMGVTP